MWIEGYGVAGRCFVQGGCSLVETEEILEKPCGSAMLPRSSIYTTVARAAGFPRSCRLATFLISHIPEDRSQTMLIWSDIYCAILSS